MDMVVSDELFLVSAALMGVYFYGLYMGYCARVWEREHESN